MDTPLSQDHILLHLNGPHHWKRCSGNKTHKRQLFSVCLVLTYVHPAWQNTDHSTVCEQGLGVEKKETLLTVTLALAGYGAVLPS